ncbi:MAG: hypothetical protein M3442_18290 [Chloroflexota bacterium]|nr:hypothetical protein [Chloroflexota bacterium]
MSRESDNQARAVRSDEGATPARVSQGARRRAPRVVAPAAERGALWSRFETPPAPVWVAAPNRRRRLLDAASPRDRLASWLEDVRRSGQKTVYWNVARIPVAHALARAVRLPHDATVDVRGDRILVVEPLRRPTA